MGQYYEKVTLRHRCGHEQTHTLPMREAFNKNLRLALTERSCAVCSKKNEIDLTKKKPDGDNPKQP